LHLLALPWLVNEVSVLLQLLELNFQSDITWIIKYESNWGFTVNESKQEQLDATDSGLFSQLYLNMFRVSLRPSSGE
jgi:hypothetical protein